MRKTAMLAVMALALALAFCSKKEEGPEKQLIGKWTPVKFMDASGYEEEAAEGDMGFLEFSADGKLTITDPAGDQQVGSWKLLPEATLEMTSPTGEKEQVEIKITDDLLHLTNPQHKQTIECKRVNL